MHRAAAFLVGFLLVILAQAANAATPTFAGVPWGTSAAKAKASLVSKGFDFVKTDQDGDLDFKGEINDQKVYVYELLTPGRILVKSEVIFLTADDEVLDFYKNMKETLSEKYGTPSKTFEFWSDPYTDTDSESEHETALAVGKGTFSSFWEFSDRGAIWMEITQHLALSLNYESPAWATEVKRRKNAGNSVL